MSRYVSIALAALLMVCSACTKKDQSATAPTGAPASAAGGGAASSSLEIGSVGETIAYDKTTLEVKAGSQITLTLRNNATSPAMKHNWVLLKPGAADAVGQAALQTGESKNYIPDSPDILAHTPLAGPGQIVTVTFTAPAAGEYPYICTFPGHYTLMKGVLKSVP